MATIAVRYAAFTNGGPDVLVPSGQDTEERTLHQNDVVFSVSGFVHPFEGANIPAVQGSLLVLEGEELVNYNPQPTPGDVIVVTCPATDVPSLAGSTGVVLQDGTLYSSVGGFINSMTNGESSPLNQVPNAITPMAEDSPVTLTEGDNVICVSADTQQGDIEVILPPSYPNRPPILIANRTGGGTVKITAASPIVPTGDTTLHLAPARRVSLQTFGGGWECLGL